MTKLEVTKAVASFIVAAGTSKIVSQIIKNNTNPESVTEAVTMTAGAIVLGSMAADASKKYTDASIDSIANWYKENIKKNA